MRSKLTMKNLRIFNSIDPEGCVIRTPEASEVGELDSRYRLAYWLYNAARKGKVSKKQYYRHAEYLDHVPLVSSYFRLLCSQG